MEKKSILVVDDEKNVRFTVLHALKSEGFDVDSAGSGVEGLQKAGSRIYDLLLVDLRMPGMTGLEMLREIRRQQPEMPAVVITAYGVPQQLVEAAQLGAIDVIRKPFSIQTIRSVVHDVLLRSEISEGGRPESADAWLAKGKHELMTGRCVEASEHFARAVELDPLKVESYILLGVCSLLKSDVHPAREFFHCALKIDPSNKIAGEFLAWLSTAQG